MPRPGVCRPDPPASLARALRCPRASATIECALGAVVLVVVLSATLGVYTAVQTRVSLARANLALADHLSREQSVASSDLMRIAGFLAAVDQHAQADIVHVATAIHNPAGLDGTKVLWSHDATRIGDPGTTARLAAICSQRTDGIQGPSVNEEPITLSDGERIIVVESCAQGRGITRIVARVVDTVAYRVHVIPFRQPAVLPRRPA